MCVWVWGHRWHNARGDYNNFTNVVFQRNMDLHISNWKTSQSFFFLDVFTHEIFIKRPYLMIFLHIFSIWKVTDSWSVPLAQRKQDRKQSGCFCREQNKSGPQATGTSQSISLWISVYIQFICSFIMSAVEELKSYQCVHHSEFLSFVLLRKWIMFSEFQDESAPQNSWF